MNWSKFEVTLSQDQIDEGVQVRCSNSAQGCEWTSSQAKPDDHLKSEGGCLWADVEFPNWCISGYDDNGKDPEGFISVNLMFKARNPMGIFDAFHNFNCPLRHLPQQNEPVILCTIEKFACNCRGSSRECYGRLYCPYNWAQWLCSHWNANCGK